MWEFHVDDCSIFSEKAKEKKFGGFLSVIKPLYIRPDIIIGKDETVFKKCQFTKKMDLTWRGKVLTLKYKG